MARRRKTGAEISPNDADYMWVTPSFRAGSPCFVVLFIEGRNAKERQTERETSPCLWMYYTAVTNGYVVPRGPSGFREDGFYFEVFPPIVHYHRELLLKEAEVSKNGSRVFSKLTDHRYLDLCGYLCKSYLIKGAVKLIYSDAISIQ